MRKIILSNVQAAGLLGLGLGLGILTGCAGMQSVGNVPAVVTGAKLQGAVHGGQQPITGATIQLYAASTSGYGGASYSLLPTGIVTDGAGAFNITGDYTCPTASSQVYIVATGGNPGGGINSNSAAMAALGACGNLSSSTFININEVTTVGSVWALAPFMTSYANVGTSAGNVQGLTNAFAAVNKLVNIGSGLAPGAALPTGATVPVSEIYALADILSACVNTTGGTAGDTTGCGKLFTAATPSGGVAPTDTIGAALNIAKNPSSSVSALMNLIPGSAPFQPTVASANDFTISIKYTATGLNKPSAAAVDPSGNLWVTSSTGNTVSVLAPTGAQVAGSPYSGSGLSGPSGIAIDASGNAWVANKTASSMTVFTSAGTGSVPSVTTLSTPTAVSIDGQGKVWVTNSGNNSVTAIATSGTTATSSTAYTGAGIAVPVAVAVNPN